MSESDAVAEVVRSIEGGDDYLSKLRRVARLALPLDAVVAVVSQGDEKLLDLHVPRAMHFPRAEGEPGSASPQMPGPAPQ